MQVRVPMVASNADLERVSEANPGWKVEREADGSITMSPTGSASGCYEAMLVHMLHQWNDAGAGGKVFSSSAGFTMPDEALLSPDGAWVRGERWRALTADERETYASLVPDVCVEIVSKSDSPREVKAKLKRYLAYGARYVVLSIHSSVRRGPMANGRTASPPISR
jgi:Uma2 family endonuclease